MINQRIQGVSVHINKVLDAYFQRSFNGIRRFFTLQVKAAHSRLATVFAMLLAAIIMLTVFSGCRTAPEPQPPGENGLKIGWASADITPNKPSIITGQRYLRVCEGVMDPVTATAIALEAENGGEVIMISCDLISIPDEIRGGDFRGKLRDKIAQSLPDGTRPKVVLNATHTHAGPEVRTAFDRAKMLEELGVDVPKEWARWGVELPDAVSPPEYIEFATDRIADAAVQAWQERRRGGISFGLSHAVVGHNRIMAYEDGTSQMYGSTDRREFSHVEGWEDHSANLIYTWDENKELTGLVVNIPSPAQHDGNSYKLSADFYHETREELRAWVWINGEFVGEHIMGPSGWDKPFFIEVTDVWNRDGSNQITIKAQNTAHAGGIWQPIRLRLFR